MGSRRSMPQNGTGLPKPMQHERICVQARRTLARRQKDDGFMDREDVRAAASKNAAATPAWRL